MNRYERKAAFWAIVIMVAVWVMVTFILAAALAYIADADEMGTVHQWRRACGEAVYVDEGPRQVALAGTFYAAGECVDMAAVYDAGVGPDIGGRVLPMVIANSDFRTWQKYHCVGGSCFDMPARFLSVGLVDEAGDIMWFGRFDTWAAQGWIRSTDGRSALPVGYDWPGLVREYVKHHRGERLRVIIAERVVWGQNAWAWPIRFAVEGVAYGGR